MKKSLMILALGLSLSSAAFAGCPGGKCPAPQQLSLSEIEDRAPKVSPATSEDLSKMKGAVSCSQCKK